MKIAIDDFGTGYSSLLVRTIISLARSFKMTVVAEGVETHEQLGLLWDLECDQSQGYLHSKPVAAVELVERLRSTRNGYILPPEPASTTGVVGS